MNITEFIEGRGVKINAVCNYISRHPELFEGHTQQVGKKTELDEVAIEHLAEKYPMKVIEVIEDKESRQKLITAQEIIIQLQTKLNEQAKAIAENEAMKLLLDDKEARLAAQEAEIKAKEAELKETRAELGKYHKTVFGLYKKER